MSWQEIVRQLHALHEVRKTMSHASNYHGSYIDEAVRLNERLLKAIGKNYCDLPASMIANCVNA